MSGFTPGRETWRIKIEKQLDQFCTSDEIELQFPPTLSSEERRFVHSHAPKLGLKSKSQGKAANRFLVVSKPVRVVPLKEDAPKLDLATDARTALDEHFKVHPPSTEELRDAREGRVADAKPSPEPGTVRSTLKNVKNRDKSRASAIDYAAKEPECATAPAAMIKCRRKLPAWDARRKVVDLVARHDVVLVAGETGCGKSTQVPQFLFDASDGKANIACSQPRRLSAIAVAERVASERGEQCGQTIGYQVRFESSFSSRTRLLFATPGVLLRKLGSDPDLVSYTHFLLDEVHEEDRDTEFLLVALRELVARRREAYDAAPATAPPPLKLVLMSATLGLSKLSDYFGGCPSCSMGGTNFPVTTFFLEDVLKQTKYVTLAGDVNSRAEALKTDDQGFKDEVVAASKVLDAGLKCATCGRAGFGSVEELGDHAAECFGDFSQEKDAMTGDDDAAVLAEMLRTRDLDEDVSNDVEFVAAPVYDDDDGRRVSSGTTGGQVHQDAEGDALVRQYQRAVDDQSLDPDLVCALVEYILYSSYDKGAILVFVSGWADIERCQERLESSEVAASLWVVPLHGSIESSKQREAFREPSDPKQWKVVLATNVAETSVTIPDVSFVLDAGLEKIVKYDEHLGASVLRSGYVSQASANQRRGRAGRTRPGVCFRLYTRRRHDVMEVSRPSELLRLNLEGLCLHATALRVIPSTDIEEASWTARDFLGRALNAPRDKAVEHAVRSLIAMGALYADDELATPLGAALAHLPLDPRPALAACYGRLLCGARSADAFRAICCMDGKDPFVSKAGKDGSERNNARREFGGQSRSDVAALRNAAAGFASAGAQKSNYCRRSSLGYSTLMMVENAAGQLEREVPKSGVNSAPCDDGALDAVACVALHPNVAARDPGKGSYATRQGANCRVHNRSLAGDRESPFASCNPHEGSTPQLLCFGALLESDAAFRTGLKLATLQPCAPLTLALLCHSDVARSGSTLLIDGWLRYVMDNDTLDRLLVLRLRLRAALAATITRAPLGARLRKAADAARDVLAAEQRRLIGTGRNAVGGAALRGSRGRGRGGSDRYGGGGGRGRERGEGRGRGRGEGRGRARGGKSTKDKGPAARASARTRKSPAADADGFKKVLKKK